jgi:hypothetical protein
MLHGRHARQALPAARVQHGVTRLLSPFHTGYPQVRAD